MKRTILPVDIMPTYGICAKCGEYLSIDQSTVRIPCPKCGSYKVTLVTHTADNYSGSVAVSASNYSAFEAINYAKNMLGSIAFSDPKRAPFVEPVIEKLNVAAKAVEKQEIELAHSRKTDWAEYEKKVGEYEGLLSKSADETEFQKFFENNPIFLESKVKTSVPKASLGGESYPDFFMILHDSSYVIVEIEKPGVKLFTQIGDPKAEFTHAQQQIRDYLQWAIEDKEYLRKRGFPNLTANNVRGLLVIGRSSDLKAKELAKLEGLNAEVRGKYEIKTFDRILEENEAWLKNLKKMLAPK